MRRALSAVYVAATAFGLPSCSMPDGDDIADLASGIRSLPAASQGVGGANKRNDRLLDVIRRRDPGSDGPFTAKRIGSVTCAEPTPEEFREWALPFDPPVLTSHLIDWLLNNPSSGLDGLRRHLESTMTPGRATANLPGNPPCTPKLVLFKDWDIDVLEQEAEDLVASSDDATDSAFWLPTLSVDDLKGRPVLMGVLGLALVGGVIVISVSNPVIVALCPKSDAVPCPGNPTSPGQDPVVVPVDEGDR